MPFIFRDRTVSKEYHTEFHGGLGKQSKLEASKKKSAQLVFKGNSKRAQQHSGQGRYSPPDSRFKASFPTHI